jgi:hypothetical protein
MPLAGILFRVFNNSVLIAKNLTISLKVWQKFSIGMHGWLACQERIPPIIIPGVLDQFTICAPGRNLTGLPHNPVWRCGEGGGMKKFRLIVILVMGWLCVLALPTFAGRQDFVLFNDTGYNIEGVFLAHVSWEGWSEDVLGNRVLVNKAYTTVKFSGVGGSRYWNIKVALENGRTFQISEVDLIDAEGILLTFRNGRLYYDVITREDLRRLRERE